MSELSDERFDVLSRVPLFEAFSESELAAVSGAAKERRFDTGDLIVGEAEPGVGFFVVTEGEARVEVHGERVGTLGAGASFGDSALLDEEPARAFTVVAESPMAVLGITTWQFSPLLEQHPEMALKLAKALARRVRALEERVTANW